MVNKHAKKKNILSKKTYPLNVFKRTALGLYTFSFDSHVSVYVFEKDKKVWNYTLFHPSLKIYT